MRLREGHTAVFNPQRRVFTLSPPTPNIWFGLIRRSPTLPPQHSPEDTEESVVMLPTPLPLPPFPCPTPAIQTPTAAPVSSVPSGNRGTTESNAEGPVKTSVSFDYGSTSPAWSSFQTHTQKKKGEKGTGLCLDQTGTLRRLVYVIKSESAALISSSGPQKVGGARLVAGT